METVGLIVAIAAAIISGLAWYQARRSADAGEVSARSSESSAIAAKQQAVATSEQVLVSREQFEAERAARRDALQPFIVVDIVPDPLTTQFTQLIIENRGSSTARNVRVTFDPPVKRSREDDHPAFLIRDWTPIKEGIPALAPGRRMQTWFDNGPDRAREPDLPMRYRVRVEAEGPFPDYPPEPMTYDLDLTILATSMHPARKNMDHLVKELDEISDAIVSIDKALNKKT